jgi:HAE1 family hydrophobic/amphiphilic exporter-1
MNVSEIFIRRPVTTTMMTLALLIMGGLAMPGIPTDLFPDVASPIVVVKTAYPGAASTEVESQLTEEVENALSAINGLKTLRSSSTEGLSTVIAEFELEIPEQDAAQEVRTKLSALSARFPEDAKDPVIQLFDPADAPVVTYALVGDRPVEQLTHEVDDVIRPRLERLDGVASVELLGDRAAEVRAEIVPDRLRAHGLSLLGIRQALRDASQDLPGGRLETDSQELGLRAFSQFRSLDALRAFPLSTLQGASVPLGALGTVERQLQESRSLAKVDGEPAVMFSVQKRSGANTLAIADRVAHELEAHRLPEGMRLVTVRDGSAFIRDSVEAVWEALIIGGLLAVAVLFLFLRNWRATLIGGLAIPVSIISSFAVMYWAGFSFNMLTTLALSLVVGILVDDAVVDLENIYRHMQEGETPLRAAIKGTGEIQLAVTATTLTIVAVFLPVAFMKGTIGQFFREFGLTVSISVLFSLLVARTLTPMLAARILKVEGEHRNEAAWGPARVYARMLAWALRHRAMVLLMGVLTFVGGLALVPFIPKGFMTTADRAEFNLVIELPSGSRLSDTERMTDRAVERLKRHAEVRHVFTMIGDAGRVDRATLGVTLVERSKRNMSDRQFAREVRDELAELPGMQVMVEELGMMGQGEANLPLFIVLRGPDGALLEERAQAIAAGLQEATGFADVDLSFGAQRPELGIAIDHGRAADQRVGPASIARTLNLATMGEVLSTMELAGEDLDLRLQVAPEARRDPSALAALSVMGAHGQAVRIDSVARIVPGTSASVIERRDRERAVSISANLVPGVSVGEATQRAQRIVADLELPGSISVRFLGQSDRMNETFMNLRVALLLAVVFIYLILATQFESAIHPLTIMLSLPLSVSGAFMGLYFGGKEMGLVAMIGLIMLMGLVTKNGILLVEFAIQKRREGLDRDQAMLTAAPLRLRPILMTSSAMILGMLPIALEFGAATEFRSPMGVVVVGGLLTSTLLTLFVVPVVFSLIEQASDRARKRPSAPVGGPAPAASCDSR